MQCFRSAEYFVVLGNSGEKIKVIEIIPNQHQNIELLKLSESVEFSDYVRPVCLPQPQSLISFQLTEICWVANSWLNEMKLKIVSNSSCSKNSGNYNKSLRIQGVEDETNFCADVQTGDRDLCHVTINVDSVITFFLILYSLETWCHSFKRQTRTGGHCY